MQPLVVLVSNGDTSTSILVRRQGAFPLSATADGGQIVTAIEAARSHHDVAPLSADSAQVLPDEPSSPLSPREVQTLHLVCLGLTNRQIAAEMHITINSLKSCIRLAYRKIGVTTRTQAVMWGMRHGYGKPAASA